MTFLDRLRTRAQARRIADHVDRAEHRFGCFAQDDLVVANGTGAAVRADINLQLAALGTLMSGAAAPGTTYAYVLWADTTNGLLKQRNAANTSWIVRGSLTEAFVVARSSNTIIGVADFGKVINCTSTFTQTLTAAATLGDGFMFWIRNNGTGVITIDPNSSETIDGATTIELAPGDSCLVFCNGSAFITIGRFGNTSRPAFLATAAGATDVTGDGTVYTIVLGTEVFDQGGCFASNTFTAPVTGRYRLSGTVHFYGLLAGHNNQILQIVTSNRSYGSQDVVGAGANISTEHSMVVTELCDMDAGDTAVLRLTVSGSTKVVDIDSATNTRFSGELVC